MRRNEYNIVVNIATGIRITDAEDITPVVLADIVPDNDISILWLRAHPEQAVTVIMTVTVLKNTILAFEVRIV